MIPTEMLKNYQGRALGVATYGVGGLEKSLASRTLPGPVLHLDFEGGSGCLGPWTRRVRKWNESQWLVYTQEDRERLFQLVLEGRDDVDKRRVMARAILAPAPYVDIIFFDVMSENMETKQSPAYDELFKQVSNFNYEKYNSLVIDPLLEFSQLTQTVSKLRKGVSAMEPMEVQYWQGAQERAAILLRAARNYRDRGVFVYMTSSEFIDKDYGTDPRSKEKSAPAEEPYAIKGQLNVPGKLVSAVNHMLDIQCHARVMTGAPIWVTREEPSRSGSFNWDAKDRTGRLSDIYIQPNFRNIIKRVYGEQAQKEIYEYAKSKLG